jgi:hypothetical protein
MSAQTKYGLTVHSKERDIANVMKCCDKEAEQKYLSVPITKITARAAEYCSVLSRIMQCFRNESNNCIVGCGLSTPGKTRRRPNVQNAEVDDFDRWIMENGIEDFYL